jgi:flagellar assembly protein FliH
MGIIKRQQVPPPSTRPSGMSSAAEQASGPKHPQPATEAYNTQPHVPTAHPQNDDAANAAPDEDWSWEAFLAGELPDRRQDDERRLAYRREDELNMIRHAQDEAQNIRRAAYAEGYEIGLTEAQEALDGMLHQLNDVLAGKADMVDTMVQQVGPLAVAIAEKLLKTELACDDSLVDRLIRDTLGKVNRDAKEVIIKVHPDWVEPLRQSLAEHPPTRLKAELLVEADETIDWGSCIVESDSGMIDARFSTQISLLKKLLQ